METTDEKPVIVIGLGNPLMADEGIGVALVEELGRRAAAGALPSDHVEYHDGGCGGMSLLHTIAGRTTAVLIDCAKMGTEPGTIRRFEPDEVQTVKKLAHQSLHEVDILKVIQLARMLGQCPERIVIFGIEPERVAAQTDLTETLKSRFEHYLSVIQDEIVRGGACG